ncbi:hypothetical protein [Waddlia chondrophila]|nr:hypothetical protein [Waddlia chondrophila]
MEFSSRQFKSKVGKEIYTGLSTPAHVKIEGMRTLTQSEIEKLQSFLLEDKGYIFNRTKKCLFIPEITVTFEGKEQVVAMISFVCKQIKLIHDDQTVILDIDPMAEVFSNYIQKELIK